MIVVIDYGLGNLGSIENILKKVGATKIKISSSYQDIKNATKLILPGVGSFDTGMRQLQATGLIDLLHEKALKDKTPTLGVCLGAQLMTKGSEEGKTQGLGWFNAETIRFRFDPSQSNLKIPHMGWNTIDIKRKGALFKDMYEDPRFYFVHSFHIICHDDGEVLSTTKYGYDFVSALQNKNIMGAQFHPEKSHKFGMRLYKNFLEYPQC